MSEERFFLLVSRKLAGEASEPELKELDELIRSDKNLELFYQQLVVDIQQTESEENEADASFALHVTKMQLNAEQEGANEPVYPEQKPLRRIAAYWMGSVAAVFLCFFAYKNFFQSAVVSNASTLNEVVSKRGSKSIIKLPDGTNVWLNADSKLTYGDFKGRKIREVFLTGEAYFDVMKDSLHPFVIHTGKVNIRVLGTAFNVKSYPQDETFETALIHGRIEVTYSERPSEKFILHPNEKLIIKKNQNATATSGQAAPKIQFNNLVAVQDSLIGETAWMESKLSFTNQTLEEIANVLERQFDVKIEFKDNAPRQYTYTGLFEHEDVEKIVSALSLSQHFQYKVEGNKIFIDK